MSTDDPTEGFAARMRAAVARRGLPLARVQAHLAAAGHPVALSTLSQWQHGRRLPQSPRSLAVVDELERVLRVEAGDLRALLNRRARDVPPSIPAALVDDTDPFLRLMQQLTEPQPESLLTIGSHDRVVIDAHGSVARRSTTMTACALTPVDRYVMAHGVDPGGDVGLVTVTAGSGCRLGRVLRDPEAGLLAAELHFDRRLSPGDTVVYEVHVTDANRVPSGDYFRWTTHQIDLLVIEVTFDRDRVPSTVTAFERPRSDAPDRAATELPLERGERVHLVRSHAEPGVHGIRWTWCTG